jgi:hypothetical protein
MDCLRNQRWLDVSVLPLAERYSAPNWNRLSFQAFVLAQDGMTTLDMTLDLYIIIIKRWQ